MSISKVSDIFSATKTTVLAAGAEVVTLIHPASAQKSARLIGLYLYSAVLATFTLERTGVFTSSTPITVVDMNPADPFTVLPQVTAGSGANITTVNIINTWTIGITPPGGQLIDLTPWHIILSGGIADNLTIRTNSVTGSVTITLVWQEF